MTYFDEFIKPVLVRDIFGEKHMDEINKIKDLYESDRVHEMYIDKVMDAYRTGLDGDITTYNRLKYNVVDKYVYYKKKLLKESEALAERIARDED